MNLLCAGLQGEGSNINFDPEVWRRPRHPREPDVGIRLWNVNQRRQAPLPSVVIKEQMEFAAFHDGTVAGTRMLTGIVSEKIAFLSFTFGSGVGIGSPCSR
jgi:hypothetical protein